MSFIPANLPAVKVKKESVVKVLLPLCIIVCCFLTGCPDGTSGSVYFVSVSGSDENPGSFSRPWATLSHAALEIQPGDTVFVRGGEYRERLVLSQSGTEDAPIVVSGYPGETAIINGEDIDIPDDWGGLVEINELEYVYFSNFQIVNSECCAIQANDSKNISIEDNYTYNSVRSGIMAWGDEGLLIQGNEVTEVCTGGENECQECISVSGSSGFEIAGNHVHHGYMEGIDTKNGCTNGSIHGNTVHDLTRLGIYIDAWSGNNSDIDIYDNLVYRCNEGIRVNSENCGNVSNIHVYGNTVYENEEAGFWIGVNPGTEEITYTISNILVKGNVSRNNGLDGIRVSTPVYTRVEEISIQNNIVWNNGRAGIIISDYSENTSGLGTVRIINNTIVGNGATEDWGSGGMYVNAANAEEVLIRNNIVCENALFSIGYDSDVDVSVLTVDYNLVRDFQSSTVYNETAGDSSVSGDPLFAGASYGDFQLIDGSAAIDAGSSEEAPADDFIGTERPQGTAVDIGAFELF